MFLCATFTAVRRRNKEDMLHLSFSPFAEKNLKQCRRNLHHSTNFSKGKCTFNDSPTCSFGCQHSSDNIHFSLMNNRTRGMHVSSSPYPRRQSGTSIFCGKLCECGSCFSIYEIGCFIYFVIYLPSASQWRNPKVVHPFLVRGISDYILIGIWVVDVGKYFYMGCPDVEGKIYEAKHDEYAWTPDSMAATLQVHFQSTSSTDSFQYLTTQQ